MLSQIATELLIILGLLVLNGLFAMSEIAVVTARRVRLTHRAEEGDERARTALELAAEPTQFLSTVQVGITLVGTFAGAFGGATIAEQLAPPLAAVPGVGAYAESLALVLVVAVITFLSVVIGELVPKRIALAHSETIASLVAKPMKRLARLGGPIVGLLTGATELLLRLFRVGDGGEPTVTEEDIRALVAQGTASGTVAAVEEEILDRVLRLGDRKVDAVMTPRTDVEWVDIEADAAALRAAFARPTRSDLLVCQDGIENVLGVVSAQDLLVHCLEGDMPPLRSMLREPLFVPAAMSLLELLTRFRQSDSRTAVVLDEFGGIEGLASMADLLTSIVGEVPGRSVAAESEIVRREDGSWLIDGAAPIEAVDEVLELERPAAERGGGYRTLAGFIMAELGRLPTVGERVRRWGYTFEVVDMDGRRVDRVLVSPRLAGPGSGSM